MRRLIATALLTLPALAGPAQAQAPSTFEQYEAAKEAFLGGETDLSGFLVGYRKHLFEGIEGLWYPASVLDPGSAEDSSIPQACERNGVHITVRDEYTLSFLLNEGKDTAVETLFTSRGGSAFGQYTDAAALLHRLGLDKLPNMEQTALGPLAGNNGLATIVRPSPDILVVQANLAVPMIYARCPAP